MIFLLWYYIRGDENGGGERGWEGVSGVREGRDLPEVDEAAAGGHDGMCVGLVVGLVVVVVGGGGAVL